MRRLYAVAWLILCVGIASALFVTVWQSPERGTAFLEVLKIIISWPLVIGLLGILAGRAFKSEVAQLIRNVGTVRLTGVGEIAINQPPAPQGDTPDTPLTPTDSVAISAETRAMVDDLSRRVADVSQEKEEIAQRAGTLLREKDREVLYWWLRYLEIFLVPSTKTVLRWFVAHTAGVTRDYYHQAMAPGLIPDPQERERVFMVLLHFGLIEPAGQLFRITFLGQAFLNFLQDPTPFFPTRTA